MKNITPLSGSINLQATLWVAGRETFSVMEAQQLFRDLGREAAGFEITGPSDVMHCVWEGFGTLACMNSEGDFIGHIAARDLYYVADLRVTKLYSQNHPKVIETIASAEAADEEA